MKIKRPTKKNNNSSSCSSSCCRFIFGIFVGGLLMFCYQSPTKKIVEVEDSLLEALSSSSYSSSTTTSAKNLRSSSSEALIIDAKKVQQQQQIDVKDNKDKDEEEGWKNLHIYYGNYNDLNTIKSKNEWFAQVHQDEVVIDLVGENGYFLDLASNDAFKWTNTLALESHGWDGLCIEPNPTYWYGLSQRKCTVIGALVGGPTIEKVDVKFRGVYGGIVGKMQDKLANRKKEPDVPKESRYTSPLNKLLLKFNVPSTIDYLSLDVEGAEYLIMQHFPFESYTIKILTVERPNNELKQLFAQNDYIFLKDLAWWGETLWAHKSTGLTPTSPQILKIQTEERN